MARAEAYGRFVDEREQADLEHDPLLPRMLALLGDVRDRAVLDECCSEGFLARYLTAHGARVTGIDLSPTLIAMARTKDAGGRIDFRVGDLRRPLSEFADASNGSAAILR